MKTVLITGGAGFIGSNFVRYLHRKYPKYRIIVLDALTYAGNCDNFPLRFMNSSNFTFWHGNIRNAELVDTLVSQSEVIFHFAAETHVTRSIYDNLLFFETDVLGTQVLANAVVKYSKTVERFIHISTSEVYGTARTPYITEEHPLMPASPYASAKVGADRLIYSYWQTYNIPVIIIRPFNNYGPYQQLEKVIPRFITSCILNERLNVHGDGRAQRDWLYVKDHCEALDKVLHCDIRKIKGEVINIGSGISLDIKTIAEIIVKKMKKPKTLIKHIFDRPGQVIRHTASIEKAQHLLKWKPKISFDKGLDKTISWYKKNRSWWQSQLWMREIPIITKDGKRVVH